MKPEPRRRGPAKAGPPPRNTTADATPTLNAAIMAMAAGPALDELVGRSVLAIPVAGHARGLSTSWEGVRQVVDRLTSLGCHVHVQIHAGGCICKVLRVLDGAAVAKQLAVVEAAQVPEAVAKAAAIARLQMQSNID
jgi:hypothetical protein